MNMSTLLIIKVLLSVIVANAVCMGFLDRETSRSKLIAGSSVVGLLCALAFEGVRYLPAHLGALIGVGYIRVTLGISGFVLGFVVAWIVTAILLRRVFGLGYDRTAPVTGRIVLTYVALWSASQLLLLAFPNLLR